MIAEGSCFVAVVNARFAVGSVTNSEDGSARARQEALHQAVDAVDSDHWSNKFPIDYDVEMVVEIAAEGCHLLKKEQVNITFIQETLAPAPSP